ncbi:cobalt-precorrin-5B (C(1))-methyltransferase [Loktanella sp. S4079]|uniref:cobalt-precorrin-5B (C(1))-methyltransferase n=1 Tax=Loktanella sp. S4079 TaxID=579483 RepID=UPI0005F9EABB|nr:cobalt-precorrin-5B (C(1))-methyltransferase [Loktanella sp. S4079]KJZ20009.1 cobalt-precorrin-6A synthase [Loktanella sp. S4079]
MTRKPSGELRRGWTTGACATAATKAALIRLWRGAFPSDVQIVLPRGEKPVFPLALSECGADWARVGITKDAGDDPDVTHGALIVVTVRPGGNGIKFTAGTGVGVVTKPGLPIPVGEAAINPIPRQMMSAVVNEMAAKYARPADVEIEVSIPDGEVIAQKTWNPRLGIKGGLSILGTTGVVRPFSCAAWIASIHRGVDVARADQLRHVAGCTGATSERAVQQHFDLPDHAMLDMGDFAGGLLKYIKKNPVERVTIGGGIGKMAKLAQGAVDLHSSRSQVDFTKLAALVGDTRVKEANTALEAYEIVGAELANRIAIAARVQAQALVGLQTQIDTIVIDRAGNIIAKAQS